MTKFSPSLTLLSTISLALPTTIGQECNECGQMALTMNASISGLKTGPLQASDYAVEPVGVLTKTPSARTLSAGVPSIRTSISATWHKEPVRAASLSA